MEQTINKANDNSIKINSLQALRGFAFLGVFLGHYNYLVWTPISVSVFFILSGFLLTIKGEGKYDNISLFSSFKNAIKKLATLYPLHIFLTLLAIPFYQYLCFYEGLADLPRKVFVNLFLLQSLYPDIMVASSLNCVSWFLSTLLVLYVVFPYIYRALKRIKNTRTLYLTMLFSLFLQTVMVTIVYSLTDEENTISYWVHCCPLYRIFELVLGISLGFIVLRKKEDKKSSSLGYSIAEIITFGLLVFLVVLWNLGVDIVYFRRAPLTPVIALALVYLFNENKGFISKLLTCKPFIWIGNRSGSAFLIHYLITVYFVILVVPFQFTYHDIYEHGIYLAMCFAIVMFFSYLYDTKIVIWLKALPGFLSNHSFKEFVSEYICPAIVFVFFIFRIIIGYCVSVWIPLENISDTDKIFYFDFMKHFSLSSLFLSDKSIGYTMFLRFVDLTNIPYTVWSSILWGGCGLLGYYTSKKLSSSNVLSCLIALYLMFIPNAFDVMCGTKLCGNSLVSLFVTLGFLFFILCIYNSLVKKNRCVLLILSCFFILLSYYLFSFSSKELKSEFQINDTYNSNEASDYASALFSSFSNAVLVKGYTPGLSGTSDDALLNNYDYLQQVREYVNLYNLDELYRESVSPAPYHAYCVKAVAISQIGYRVLNLILFILLLLDILISFCKLFYHHKKLRAFVKSHAKHFIYISIIIFICLVAVTYSIINFKVLLGIMSSVTNPVLFNYWNSALPALLSISYLFVVLDFYNMEVFHEKK